MEKFKRQIRRLKTGNPGLAINFQDNSAYR
jgi:hypothetical protein